MNELDPKGDMTLLEHLSELRRCLFISCLAIVVCAAFAFNWSSEIFTWLIEPFKNSFPTGELIGTGPAEAFMLKMKVALFVGFLAALPIISLQVWRFISPGLYPKERRLFIPFVLITSLLFLGGVAFCDIFVLPVVLSFFSGQYESIGVVPAVRVSEHLSFLLQVLFAAGVLFELPVVLALLTRLGLVSSAQLKGGFRYAIVIIFIVAAVLTPPDVLSQILLAIPLVGLYWIGVLVSVLIEKRSGPSNES